MANTEVRVDNNGIYVFDPAAFWVGVTAGTLLGIAFGGGAVTLFMQDRKLSTLLVSCALFSVAGFAAVLYICRFRGRTVEITSDGISVHDRHGKQLETLRWVELGRVTERRKMAQIVLWDKLGSPRVRIDQQYENFKQIRSAILDQYSKSFMPQPLPFEFYGSPLSYEAFILAISAVGFGWISWISYEQHQPVSGFVLLSFSFFALLMVPKFFPRLWGASVLLEDRIVLRGFFRVNEMYKKDAATVEIQDIANPKSGTKFSFVVLRGIDGQELKITSIYGSIPEIYLTLKAWLARR